MNQDKLLLPTERPIKDAIKIYARRFILFIIVVIISLLSLFINQLAPNIQEVKIQTTTIVFLFLIIFIIPLVFFRPQIKFSRSVEEDDTIRVGSAVAIIDSSQGKRAYPISVKQPLLIGRGNENDIVIDNQEVSRRHALLRLTENGVEVIDLSSINGTFIGAEKKRIVNTSIFLIKNKEILWIGTVEIFIEVVTDDSE